MGVGGDQFLKNVVQANNIIVTTDPGFINLAGTTTASDFDLVKGSQLIDKGTNLAEVTSDFLDRPAPVGVQDVGAFEYQGDSAAGGGSTSVGDMRFDACGASWTARVDSSSGRYCC